MTKTIKVGDLVQVQLPPFYYHDGNYSGSGSILKLHG